MKKITSIIFLLMLVGVLGVFYYLQPGLFDVGKRFECMSLKQKFVLGGCGWGTPFCRRQGVCINSFSDGGKACNSGRHCSSGICNVSKEGMAEFEKQLPKKYYEIQDWTSKVKIPDKDIGYCKRDDWDGSCLEFYVYVDKNNKVNNPHCVQ